MKNSIKFFLLSLFTPLFIGVSFGYDYYGGLTQILSDSFSWSSSSSSKTFVSNFSPKKSYCGLIYGGSSNYAITYVKVKCQSNNTTHFVSNGNIGKGVYFCFTNYMCTSNADLVVETSGAPMSSSYNINLYSLDLPVDLPACPDCSEIESNYNTCLDRVNTLNGQVGTLSGSLQSCQSDLASCTNSCDTLVSQCLDEKSTIQTTLSGCVEDKNSLQNYNDSLSQQLNECLESGTGGSGGTYIALYDLFWSSDGNDYSLPITNNIHLPYGYRGFLDDGVLAIKQINSLNTAYSISDDDYENKIIGSYSTIFLFLISSGLFLVFLFAIRKYFIGLKSF